MPVYCSAYGCNNRRNTENISRGITFHKFPKDRTLRRRWEFAVRREAFSATEASKLCSEHFRPPDFDRTGQIVRLREGVVPSVFNFSAVKTTAASRTSKALRKAETGPPEEPPPPADHSYALPDSPSLLKARLTEALARVERLERQQQSVKARQRRASRTVHSLLVDLKRKQLINRELKQKLHHFSDLQLDCFSQRGLEYTPQQREFALTLHLHGPKAYSYLRDSLQLPLPHPHTLTRWMHMAKAAAAEVEAEPGADLEAEPEAGLEPEADLEAEPEAGLEAEPEVDLEAECGRSSVMLDMCVSVTESCGDACDSPSGDQKDVPPAERTEQ